MEVKRILVRLRLALRRLSVKNKILILSLVVGCASGLSAVLLRSSVELVKTWTGADVAGPGSWRYLILPGVGMLISLFLLRNVIKDNISHGVTKVLVAVSRNESRIKPHNMWSSMLTSALTIGFGGSVGAEAPIVYTGAAIGSNFARYMGLSYRNMTLMLGCGAAGAIAGIFKAPLAGVIFTMEVLLFNVTMTSILPLLLSTVSATVIAYIFTGQNAIFECTLSPFAMVNLPFYVLLGIVCGFGSLYFTRMTLWLEDKFGKFRNPYVRWAFCAVCLGLLIFIFPSLYGEGYGFLGNLLNGGEVMEAGPWMIPLVLLAIFLLKVFSMTLTNAGGGVGGTFGPTLFEGAIMGFLIARVINLVFINSPFEVPEQNFALVGMAAMMAGVMQAPLTAIFLIAETSGGYQLFLPLILTSAISFGTVRIFEKYSIYTKRIAQSGDLLTHDKDQAALTLLKLSDYISDKYPHLDMNASLRKVAPVIAGSSVSVYPVVDNRNRFQGLVAMENANTYFWNPDNLDTLYVRNIMEQPLDYIFEDERMDSVMDKFDRSQAWRLPVVREDMTYLGFISKSRILMAYRAEMKQISEE